MSRRRAGGIAAALAALLAGAAVAADTELEVELRGGQPAGGMQTLAVTHGDTVAIEFRSDEEVTLHLHGYDHEVTVPAGGRATLRLEAGIAGRFPIESHGGGHATLLYLEVRPD